MRGFVTAYLFAWIKLLTAEIMKMEEKGFRALRSAPGAFRSPLDPSGIASSVLAVG